MYTPFGKKQRDNLLTLANLGDKMLDALRPVVEKVPNTVIERVKSTGSGATDDGGAKKFIRTHNPGATSSRVGSPYYPDWAKRRSGKGLQTSKKDFWFDGNMWGTFKITDEAVTGTGVSFTLSSDGAVGHNGEYLVDIHSRNQDVNILNITNDEWEKLQNQMMAVLDKEFSKYL